ncbi:hypothetical protein C1H46_040302 [Malus baccata]|uniref:Uncharacterized protein n=1 Tax=Malus baccata TaxID=106549 RepID=A0A540KIW8_MALBA|nr:hypothetical protein C1H46_040302 [Malus baccata]
MTENMRIMNPTEMRFSVGKEKVELCICQKGKRLMLHAWISIAFHVHECDCKTRGLF